MTTQELFTLIEAKSDRATAEVLAAIEKGINQDAYFDRDSLLLRTCETLNIEIANKLLDLGANPNLGRKQEFYLPLMALAGKDLDNDVVSLIRRLVECGADVNAVDKDGWSAMMYGKFSKKPLDIAFLLLDLGANPTVKHTRDIASLVDDPAGERYIKLTELEFMAYDETQGARSMIDPIMRYLNNREASRELSETPSCPVCKRTKCL